MNSLFDYPHAFPKTNQFWDEEKTREISFGDCWGSNGERDYMRQIALDALNYNNQIVENCLWKIISLIDNVEKLTFSFSGKSYKVNRKQMEELYQFMNEAKQKIEIADSFKDKEDVRDAGGT